MSRVSGTINAVAYGLSSRSLHTHWNEVNPIGSQGKDKSEVRRETRVFIKECEAKRKLFNSPHIRILKTTNLV